MGQTLLQNGQLAEATGYFERAISKVLHCFCLLCSFLLSRFVYPWWNAWVIFAIWDDHQEIGMSYRSHIYFALLKKDAFGNKYWGVPVACIFILFCCTFNLCMNMPSSLNKSEILFTPYQLFLAGNPTDVENTDLIILSSQWAGVACIRQVKLSKFSFILLVNSI